MASFPYIPTTVLPDPSNDGFFYIFGSKASSSSPSSAHLLALNVSANQSFDVAALPTIVASESLPFITDGRVYAYTPMVDEEGEMLVYTGSCQNLNEESTLWQYKLADTASSMNGTWSQFNVTLDSDSTQSELAGANYLASGIAFSNSANSSTQMYVFGGMCPDQRSTASSNTWTKDAEYSNSMLVIEPTDLSSSQYQVGLSSSRGPPIPEAGFTITPLQPTFSQPSEGNETQHRSQNFLLLGGHTQTAFINMSQVALFSLPQQSWNFIPIGESDAKTELAARKSPIVDPRSGHTAVLTADGKRIVVFGGWVGNTSSAAEPQLAILELGDGYGGSGSWRWTIPDVNGTGLQSGVGLYGHGAAMLPGDVMMITGGYITSGSSTTKVRRADAAINTENYLLNTSSNTWVSSYTHPESSARQDSPGSSDADRLTTSKRVGLGAGLTFGVLAAIAVTVIYFWYSRRLKRRLDAREDELRHLGRDVHPSHSSMLRPGGSLQPQSEMTIRVSGEKPLPRYHQDAEAERTGLLFEIPSPTRGLRRSLHSRGNYQPAPRYDDGRLNRGSGNIHPIDERDEYDEKLVDGGLPVDTESYRKDHHEFGSAPVLDPFLDSASRTPSPQSPARERELERQSWVSDWAAADALMHQHGRYSPERNDRTSSTLSDQSTRSMVSAQSWQHSAGSMSRSMSQRSAAFHSSRPFSPPIDTSAALSPVDKQRTQSNTVLNSNTRRSQSLTLFSNPRRSKTSNVPSTSAPSFPQLQSESEALLGDFRDQSPTRASSRARDWMGSVRRVFTGADRSASTSPENGGRSASSSPTKFRHQANESGVPRRSASTGAMLWQERRGARDWDVEGGAVRAQRGDGEVGKETDEEEWDVESAVERRVVQVMFTVPKEKLRVVNRGPDGDGVSVVSRESSVKDLAKGEPNQGKGKGKDEGGGT